MPAFKGVDVALVNVIAETLFLAVYDFCVNAVDDLAEMYLDEYLFEDPPEDQDQEKKCPASVVEYPGCVDGDCAGKGGRCTTVRAFQHSNRSDFADRVQGDLKNCRCLPTVYPKVREGKYHQAAS